MSRECPGGRGLLGAEQFDRRIICDRQSSASKKEKLQFRKSIRLMINYQIINNVSTLLHVALIQKLGSFKNRAYLKKKIKKLMVYGDKSNRYTRQSKTQRELFSMKSAIACYLKISISTPIYFNLQYVCPLEKLEPPKVFIQGLYKNHVTLM